MNDQRKEKGKFFNTIQNFEAVSGLEMHRDPSRKKCQALAFGSHRSYTNWPGWITQKDTIKILGIRYSNIKEETLEKINSDLVKDSVLKKLYSSNGIRGTVMQKVQFVNSFILSKIWYVSQTICLEVETLKYIDKLIRRFIHAGENERPVQALVYREKTYGGLGLICPLKKARAFFIKNMFLQWEKSLQIDAQIKEKIYGKSDDFELVKLNRNKIDFSQVGQIYLTLLDNKIKKGASLIPSRAEKVYNSIKWGISWKNLNLLKAVNPKTKYFAWSCVQDMVPVGARLHRAQQNKLCKMDIINTNSNQIVTCGKLETLRHALCECPSSNNKFELVKKILITFFGANVTTDQIIFLSLNHRNKKKMKIAIWLIVKTMYFIYTKRTADSSELVNFIRQEIVWHEKIERWFGRNSKIKDIKRIVESCN